MEYTKGEWKNMCLGSEGSQIILNQSAIERKNRGFGVICPVVNGTNWKESQANANLISASPDMYEALKEFESLKEIDSESFKQWVLLAGKAIAKAEGR